jgi:teichoic acid transport system permease protein
LSAPASAKPRDRTDEFTTVQHVYEPHRVGLPPLGSYLRELWRRREFAFEMSRTDVRAQHFNTVFGALWLVLNPLLLACVFFVLVDILRSRTGGIEFFAHLMGALFVYHFVTDGIRQAVKSVTSGGRLILNTAFPRVLLFAILTCGFAMLVAAGNVYFRDLKNFLNYALRIWLYGSPILYYAHQIPDRYEFLMYVNPIAPLLSAWSAVLDDGVAPEASDLLLGAAWAVVLFVAGGLFFISREREFAVRL